MIAEQDIALGCAGLTERQGWGNAKDGQIFLSECWLRWGGRMHFSGEWKNILNKLSNFYQAVFGPFYGHHIFIDLLIPEN